MARKQRRSRRTRKSKKTRRHRGGMAPLNDRSMEWATRMSAGQGADYLRMHRAQHGGVAPLSVFGGESLPASLRGPAMLGGLDRSFDDIKGLKDMAGGRRKRRTAGKKSRKSRKYRGRKRGGASLGYASVSAGGMLGVDERAAGLRPYEWAGGLEAKMAAQRAAL